MTFTRKVFWEDPYRVELETRVSGVSGSEITVESTVFYALSDGQESDHGTIGGKLVLQARKEGHEVRYTLDKDHGLEVGDVVLV